MFEKTILNADQARACYKYYKQHVKLLKTIQKINFNKTCIEHNITPKYATITIKGNNNRIIDKTKCYSEKFRIRQEIKNAYFTKNKINTEMYETHLYILKTLGNTIYNHVKDNITENIEIIKKQIIAKHNKKIDTLLNNKQYHTNFKHKNKKTENKIKNSKDNNKNIELKNLTNIKFDETETIIINNAFKYNLPNNNKQKIIKDIIIDSEIILNRETDINKEDIRNDIKFNINNNITKRNISTGNKTINMNNIKRTRNKLIENNALIIKSDKTNTPIIIHEKDYNEKINQYIKENNFTEIQDPTNKYLKIIKSLINTHKDTLNFNKKIKYHTRLYPYHPAAPNLTGLLKIHKPEIPIRPLINFKTAPSYIIAKIMDKILRTKIKLKNTYNIKNGYELIKKLKTIQIDENTKAISYDITSMYPNIPINETINIIKKHLTRNKEDNKNIINITTLIRNICNQNYFKFKEKYYKQEEGLPMGSPISAIMSEIYLQEFEEKIVKSITHTHITYYYGQDM